MLFEAIEFQHIMFGISVYLMDILKMYFIYLVYQMEGLSILHIGIIFWLSRTNKLKCWMPLK